MGKGGSITIGYWYHPSFHMVLHNGPMDALLKVRGGPYDAWEGNLTGTGTITIDAPNIWGGTSAEGGIQGDMDVMFGDANQAPNSNISSLIGADSSAHRGKAAILFKGGRYGAMNPYPKPISFLTQRILNGWDNDTCWYPAKAPIPTQTADAVLQVLQVLTYDTDLSADTSSPDGLSGGITYALSSGQGLRISVPTDTLYSAGNNPIYPAWSYTPEDDYPGFPNGWRTDFSSRDASGNIVSYWGEPDGSGDTIALYPTEAEAAPIMAAMPAVILTGSSSYTIFLNDATVRDNRLGLSVKVELVNVYAGFSMNPAHIIYESIANGDMGAEPIANISDASFTAAADTLFAEGFGLCTLYDPDQETIYDFRARICAAAAMNCTRSPLDGLWYLDLVRGGGDPSLLPVLTDDDILDYQEEVASQDDTINQVSVQWYDPILKQQRTTAPVQAVGAIENFDVINAQTNNYPEIPVETQALGAAARDLAALSLPLKRLTLTTDRTPYGWRMGTYFVLNAPKRGVTSAVFLIGDIDRGTLKSGAIKLTAVQDNFSFSSSTYVVGEQGTSAQTAQPALPTPVVFQEAFELPYAVLAQSMTASQIGDLDTDAAYLGIVGVRPQTGTAGYDFDASVGGGPYSADGNGDWCPSATASAAAGPFDTSAVVATPTDLQYAQIGAIALWENECVRVDAVNTTTSTVTLGRGCADTIPAPHASGTRLYFAGGFIASDQTEYVSGETLGVKLLTRMPGLTLDASLASSTSVAMVGRQALPYPPAMVEVNGTRWDLLTSVSGSFTVSWAERNRITQIDQLIDQTAATITPEINTRYDLAFYDATDSLLVESTDIAPATSPTVTLNYTGTVTMTLAAVSDNGESLQKYSFQFSYAPVTGASQYVISGAAASLFVIVSTGPGPSYTYQDSPDGSTWTTRITADASTTDFPHTKLLGFRSDGSHWYANQNGTTDYWKSSDATWYDRPWSQTTGSGPTGSSSGSSGKTQIRYINSQWVIPPLAGSSAWVPACTSTDFTTWNAAATPTGLPSLAGNANRFDHVEILWDTTNSRYLLFGSNETAGTPTTVVRCYTSTDLATWSEITACNTAVGAAAKLGGISSDGAGVIVAWGYKGGTAAVSGGAVDLTGAAPFIIKSTNWGTAWAAVSPTYPAGISSGGTAGFATGTIGAIYDGAAHVVFVGTTFGHSTDSGVTWAFAATGITGASGYNVVTNQSSVLVAQDFGSYGVGQIVRSSDHGATWSTIPGLSSPNQITAAAYTPQYNGIIVDGGHA